MKISPSVVASLFYQSINVEKIIELIYLAAFRYDNAFSGIPEGLLIL